VDKALKQSAALCTSDLAYAVNCLHLKKARKDGLISDLTHGLNVAAANRAHIENADFIRELKAQVKLIDALELSMRDIHKAVRRLETNIVRVNDAFQGISRGLHRKIRIEACVGFVSAILNAFSFGVAGTAVQGIFAIAIGSIVDFGDVPHLCDVVEGLHDVTI